MAFHACPRETEVAAAPAGTAAVAVDHPLVCAINHDKDRERDGRTTVVVMQPFAYEQPSTGRWIWVPAGYVTDFASIPRVGRWLIPPFGRHAIAAVVHDWLYSVGEPGQRDAADDIFNEALTELGVDPARRGVMHAAVRGFGAGGYERAEALWGRSFMDWRTGDWLDPPAGRDAFFGDGDPAIIERIRNQAPANCDFRL
ncbi:MAG: DUF1353 domain-containing protein [Brevundimonas sp.]|uniref:DUF1353 domain-containing protein n=1 Tax=Brevundimonas sp. TaxID=1871086 RepID=UPI00391AEC0A